MHGVHNSAVYTGRVDVLVNGEWGTVTVCDYMFGWDKNAASIVCRQLGYPVVLGVYSRADFGRDTGRTWLAGLECNGEEESLFNCVHGIGRRYCGLYGEHVGVDCSRGKEHSILPFYSYAPWMMGYTTACILVCGYLHLCL